MPELPEVEGVVRSLQPAVTGRTIECVTISPMIYTSHEAGKQSIIKGLQPDEFVEAVTGMTIQDVTRRSKYIYFTLEYAGATYKLVNHLGMSGAFFDVHDVSEILEEKFRKHAHVTFTLDNGKKLIYSDIRRFGEMRFLRKIEDHPPLMALAPEPFDSIAKDHFLTYCALPKYSKKEIKAVVMDSHVLCGCGNIYATEALFRTKINPGRITSRLSRAEKEQLFDEIVAVLSESIAYGGSSISDYRNINGEAGGMQGRLQMYGMNICPMCHTNSEQKIIAGRNSYYCPNCQK